MGRLRPAHVNPMALGIAIRVRKTGIQAVFGVETVVHRDRRIAVLANISSAFAQARTIRQGFVGVTGIKPATVVIEHQAAVAVAVKRVHIDTGAVVLGLIDVGVYAGVVGQRPVD